MGAKQVLIAVDQLANTLLGGYADETISARAWRKQWESRPWALARRAIDLVFGFGHCQESDESERQRRHSPTSQRQG